MNCCISWHTTAATSWDLIFRNVPTSAGTTPSTARSLSSARHTTTCYWYQGTRVTSVMRSSRKIKWCSPRMTATTTRTAIATVQRTLAADSGTRIADRAGSTVIAVDHFSTGNGLRRSIDTSTCSQHACGWRARARSSGGCRLSWHLQHQRYGSVNLLFQTLSEDSSFLLLLA